MWCLLASDQFLYLGFKPNQYQRLRCRQKGLVFHTTPNGEILWVHPDLLEDEQWTTSTSKKKSNVKGKEKSYYGASVIPEKNDEEIPALPLSEEE